MRSCGSRIRLPRKKSLASRAKRTIWRPCQFSQGKAKKNSCVASRLAQRQRVKRPWVARAWTLWTASTPGRDGIGRMGMVRRDALMVGAPLDAGCRGGASAERAVPQGLAQGVVEHAQRRAQGVGVVGQELVLAEVHAMQVQGAAGRLAGERAAAGHPMSQAGLLAAPPRPPGAGGGGG